MALACATHPTGQPASITQSRHLYTVTTAPELAKPLGISEPSSSFELTGSSQTYPSFRVSFRGNEFVVAVDAQGAIQYIATSDPGFSTPENVRVGSSLSEVRKAGAQEPLAEPGWAFHAALPSGWRVAFVNGSSLTEQPLPANARVAWLFKRL